MENEKHLSPTDFKLDSFEIKVLDIFYLSLKQQIHLNGSLFEIESYIVKKYCEDFNMDFCEILKICKRLVNVKNREN